MDYDETDKFKALSPILEEDTIWFSEVSKAVAYPTEYDEQIKHPVSFNEWYNHATTKDDFNPLILRDLSDAHRQMMMEGRTIIDQLDRGEKPSADDFFQFADSYNNYATKMRRLEHDSAIEGAGVDQETGLRLHKMLDADMKRELERLERQGTSFCLTMFRIDGYEKIKDQDKSIAMAVAHIKKTMRPFDDAYYKGEGRFILSMKQTDIIGAEAGINRLRKRLDQDSDNIYRMTMTFCLVEPTVGDKADDLIEKMNFDLEENKDAQDTILKFKEISDLERYIGAMK